MHELVQSHDLTYLANHDYGPRFPEAFRSTNVPVVVSVRSFRFDDAAVSFIRDRAAVVVCCNMELRRIFEKHSGRCFCIRDGIGSQFRATQQPIIGFVGRKSGYKGFPLIKDACRELGFALRVADCDYFDMPEFYDSVDCIVVASENEGMNTIPFEAMACNCPVVTTDVGAAKVLDCIKIERSVEGIKVGLLKLFGRTQVWPDYAWSNLVQSWQEVFDSL